MELKLFVPRLWFRQDLWLRSRRYVRAFLYTFNLHTLALAALAALAVSISLKFKFVYSMDFTLVATVFTIQQAFTRREKAISLIANLKASAAATYYMHRDWAQDERFPSSMGNDHSKSAMQCRHLLLQLLRDVQKYLTAPSSYESYAEARLCAKGEDYRDMFLAHTSLGGVSQASEIAEAVARVRKEPAGAALKRCYRVFSKLSVLNEQLTFKAGYKRGGEGGMSRTNQYLRYMVANLEELRMLKEYRTPIMMRYANGLLLHIFAVMLAPYFCHFCDSWVAYGYSWDSCPAGYSASIVYVVIVMLLYNVQQDIEQPFDMTGLDDVFFDEVLDEVTEDVMEPGMFTVDTAGSTALSSPRLSEGAGRYRCSSPTRQVAEMLGSRAGSLPRHGSLGCLDEVLGKQHKMPATLQLSPLHNGRSPPQAVPEEGQLQLQEEPLLERQDSGEQLIKAGTVLSSSPGEYSDSQSGHTGSPTKHHSRSNPGYKQQ